MPDLSGWTPLHYAALLRDEGVRHRFFRPDDIKAHVEIRLIQDNIGRSPIHVAVTTGSQSALEWSIACLKDENSLRKTALSTSGIDQMTPLHLGMAFGTFKCIERILEVSSQMLSKSDFWGREAIHLAASHGHEKVAGLLLDRGAQPYSVDEFDMSPMDYLLKDDPFRNNSKSSAEDTGGGGPEDRIASQTPKIHLEEGAVALNETLESDSLSRTRRMFLRFALKNPNFRDKSGLTYLHHAVQRTDMETVRSLIDQGYDLKQSDTEGRSALHLAVLAKPPRPDMAMFLLRDYGAEFPDLSVTDKQKETVLMLAAREGHIDLVKRFVLGKFSDTSKPLIAKSAVENNPLKGPGIHNCGPLARNAQGRTALHLAIRGGHQDVVRFLLKEIQWQDDYKDDEGESVLTDACRHTPSRDCVAGVLRCWPESVDTPDTVYGQTPLCWACERGDVDVVEVLLAHEGIDVNKQAKDWRDYTPLHFAVGRANSIIVKLLLENPQVNIQLQDRYGKTPLDKALEDGDADIIQTILTHRKIDIQTCLKALKQLSSWQNARFHSMVPEIFGQIQPGDVSDEDLLDFLESFEDSPVPALYEIFVQHALRRENTRMKLSQYPLHLAARLNDLELMELLCILDNVQSTLLDADGWTCLEYAQTCRSEPLGAEQHKLAEDYSITKHRSRTRTTPSALDTAHIQKGLSVLSCVKPDHRACNGVQGKLCSRSSELLKIN